MPSPPSWSHLHQSDFSSSNSAHCLSYRCAYCGTDRSDRWTDGSTYGSAERSAYCGTDGSTDGSTFGGTYSGTHSTPLQCWYSLLLA